MGLQHSSEENLSPVSSISIALPVPAPHSSRYERAAGQDNSRAGGLRTDELWQRPGGAALSDEPAPREGGGDVDAGGGEAHVAVERDGESHPSAGAVDRGDHLAAGKRVIQRRVGRGAQGGRSVVRTGLAICIGVMRESTCCEASPGTTAFIASRYHSSPCTAPHVGHQSRL